MKLWSTMRVKLRDRALKDLKQKTDFAREETDRLRRQLTHQSTKGNEIMSEMKSLRRKLSHEHETKEKLKEEIRRLRKRESNAVVDAAREEANAADEISNLRSLLAEERMKRQLLSEQVEELERRRDGGTGSPNTSRAALRKLKAELEKERKTRKELEEEVKRLRLE
eukprot:UN26445